MASQRTTVRARGPYVRNLRVLGFLVAVFLVPVADVRDRAGLSVLIAVVVFILWQGLLCRPRIVVGDQCLHVYWLIRSLHRPVSALDSVDLVPGTVLWYQVKELSLVVDDRVIFYPWVAWSDDTVIGPDGFGWTGTSRQRRLLDRIRAATQP